MRVPTMNVADEGPDATTRSWSARGREVLAVQWQITKVFLVADCSFLKARKTRRGGAPSEALSQLGNHEFSM